MAIIYLANPMLWTGEPSVERMGAWACSIRRRERTFVVQAALAFWLKEWGWYPELEISQGAWANFIDTANRFALRFNEFQRDAFMAAIKRVFDEGELPRPLGI